MLIWKALFNVLIINLMQRRNKKRCRKKMAKDLEMPGKYAIFVPDGFDVYFNIRYDMYFRNVLLFVILLSLAGCNMSRDGADATEDDRTSVVVQGNELTLTGPDGELRMSAEYFPMPEDQPGCFEIIAHTDGKDVFTSLWLICCVYNDTRVGEELKLEHVDFCAALSSDSRNYATSFTGRMILKERTMGKVVIGIEDVHFSILHGEYALNGDLVGLCFDR